MIRKLSLKNFKSHKEVDLDFGNLTLLCGQNGVGKSSVIQSLLLLRQTYEKGRLAEGLNLNLPLVEIGEAKDAIHANADEDNISIKIETATKAFYWKFLYVQNNGSATFMDLDDTIPKIAANELREEHIFSKYFQYLSAARLAPRESYPKDDYEVERNRQISMEKGQGELVAHFLHYYGQKITIVDESLKNSNSQYEDLLSQTIAWEREISKNINVVINNLGKGFEIKYFFNREDGEKTDDFRAENVGFGVTYVLPIIVAILSSPKGGIVIVENPEAHLHPYAQAKLAELMCLAAQAGIQIIVETHSDHIINGCLVACKKEKIEADNIKVHYFDRDETTHAARATLVPVLKGGKIKKPPIGFFDQIGKDIRTLMS